MKWLGIIVVWLLGATSAAAACPPELLARLLDQGFSREDVLQVCGAGQGDQAQPSPAEPGDRGGLPAWLSGDWNVTRTIEGSSVPGWGFPPTTQYWRIEARANATLAITEVQDAQLMGTGLESMSPVEVRDTQVSGGRLSFTTRKRFAGSIYTDSYELELSDEEDFVTGRWRSHSVSSYGGPIEMWGTVQMIKN